MSRIMMRESPVKEVKPIIKIFKDAFPNNLVVTITKNGDPLLNRPGIVGDLIF